jgi:hypothetical protein
MITKPKYNYSGQESYLAGKIKCKSRGEVIASLTECRKFSKYLFRNAWPTPKQQRVSVTFVCTREPFFKCRQNCNKVVTLATLAARIESETMMASMVGSGGVSVRRSLKSGVRMSALCWWAWQSAWTCFYIYLVYKEIENFVLSMRFVKIMLH